MIFDVENLHELAACQPSFQKVSFALLRGIGTISLDLQLQESVEGSLLGRSSLVEFDIELIVVIYKKLHDHLLPECLHELADLLEIIIFE